MESNKKRHREFSTDLLFPMEQWVALPLGIACLAVFVWAALDGQEAFAIRHLSHFSATTLAFVGWSLTFAVGLCGVTLMKFAFYKKGEPKPDAKWPRKRVRIASGGSTQTLNRFVSVATNKRSR